MRRKDLKVMRTFIKNTDGQAMVELAIVLPVIIIIAVIAVNALTFFSQCSAFDRTFKQIASTIGTSPGYGKDIGDTKALLETTLEEKFNNEFLEFEVSVNAVSGGFQEFKGQLKMHPTLFGMGLRGEVFGVPLLTLNHEQRIVIEVYKPGVIF